MPKAPAWSGKSLKLLHLGAEQGEAKIKAQLQIALSADNRATVLAGIFGAAALACAGVAGVSDLRNSLWIDVGAAVAFSGFVFGAALCIWSARPVDFRAPGNRPSAFYGDIEQGASEDSVLGSHLENLEEDYQLNQTTLGKNAAIFTLGSRIGVAAPVLGVLAAFLARFALLP